MTRISIARVSSVLSSLLLLTAVEVAVAQDTNRDFTVREASATGLDGEVRIVAEMELMLSDPVEEAVNNGIPITIVKQVAVPRNRLVLKRRRVKSERSFEVRKHALSDRYIVTDMASDLVKTYPTVSDALRAIGSASTVEFELPPEQYSDPPQVQIRVFLDVYALPTALRLRAIISRTWRHSSGWTNWEIAP